MIKLVENPLAKAAATEIKVAEVAARRKSPTSIMPKGLLDKLTRDEIMDLVAFLTSRSTRVERVIEGVPVVLARKGRRFDAVHSNQKKPSSTFCFPGESSILWQCL